MACDRLFSNSINFVTVPTCWYVWMLWLKKNYDNKQHRTEDNKLNGYSPIKSLNTN